MADGLNGAHRGQINWRVVEEVELQAPKEGDQLFVNYFRDFSNLDLKAIVSYFHLPCTFIVP